MTEQRFSAVHIVGMTVLTWVLHLVLRNRQCWQLWLLAHVLLEIGRTYMSAAFE